MAPASFPTALSLPSLSYIYHTRLTRKATRIAGEPHPPISQPFQPTAAVREETAESLGQNQQLKDCFFHLAVGMLNSLPTLPPLHPISDSGPQVSAHTHAHLRPAHVTLPLLYLPTSIYIFFYSVYIVNCRFKVVKIDDFVNNHNLKNEIV